LQWGEAWEETRDWETEEERFRRTGKKHRDGGGGGVSRPGSPQAVEDEKEDDENEIAGEGDGGERRDHEEKEMPLEYALWEQ